MRIRPFYGVGVAALLTFRHRRSEHLFHLRGVMCVVFLYFRHSQEARTVRAVLCVVEGQL